MRDEFVLVYSGSLGAWYREAEMVRFYACLRRRRPARLLVCTHSPTERLEALVGQEEDALRRELLLRRVPPLEMPAVLAATDAAISLITPCQSKLGSSPTKIAEYLAMGLPTVLNRGIGDSDRLIDEVPAIFDAGSLGAEELEGAAERLVTADLSTLRESARRAAVERFSVEDIGIPRYCRLYERLAR